MSDDKDDTSWNARDMDPNVDLLRERHQEVHRAINEYAQLVREKGKTEVLLREDLKHGLINAKDALLMEANALYGSQEHQIAVDNTEIEQIRKSLENIDKIIQEIFNLDATSHVGNVAGKPGHADHNEIYSIHLLNNLKKQLAEAKDDIAREQIKIQIEAQEKVVEQTVKALDDLEGLKAALDEISPEQPESLLKPVTDFFTAIADAIKGACQSAYDKVSDFSLFNKTPGYEADGAGAEMGNGQEPPKSTSSDYGEDGDPFFHDVASDAGEGDGNNPDRGRGQSI